MKNTHHIMRWTCFITSTIFIIVSDGAMSLPVPRGQPLPPSVDCSKSTLTGKQFMEMYQTIAMHGDLRDIPFIEKTLGVKFHSEHTHQTGSDGRDELNIHDTIYNAAIPNSYISVNLRVNDDIEMERVPRGSFADMNFNAPDHSFARCLHITSDEFNSYFSNSTFVPMATLPGEVAGILAESFKGKNGSEINVSDAYSLKDKIVGGVALSQTPF